MATAQQLKALLHSYSEADGEMFVSVAFGDLASLLSATYPRTRLSEMIRGSDQRESLELVIREYRQQAKLRAHGLSPRRKLLLVGPPGVGKTMTSWALAGELKLPHFTVQLHSLITKFMGETAAKLFAAHCLAAFKIGKDACCEAATFAQGMSHAEVSRSCDEAAKLAVLDNRRTIVLNELRRAIELRRASRSLSRN